MSLPIYGKDGVVLKDTTEIAKIENVELTVEAEAVEARCMGSDWPDDIISGVKSVRGEIGKFYIDPADFFDLIKEGTEVTIKVRPKGTGTGKLEYIISEAVITSWGYSHPYNNYIRERVRFTGKTIDKAMQA